MRRLIILLLCCLLLTGVVNAANSASNVQNVTTVYADGSCQVMLTVNIRLDSAVQDLTFPLPRGAKDVTLNGSPVRARPSSDNGNVSLVDLSYLDGVLGDQSLTFRYSLSNVVEYVEPTEEELEDNEDAKGKLMLNVPLLAGFEYPVNSMSFSITMPSTFETVPYFYSGYFQQSIESSLTYDVNGNVISGSVTEQMKDKETLTMSMEVTQEMFSGKVFITSDSTVHLTLMWICAILALVFWLLLMRSAPVYYHRRTEPIEGIHAGEVGSRLAMNGADLTMMVFQWAQLGYLRIQPDRQGHVWLLRRMDMGNERSAFEIRCFNMLFGNTHSVDGTGNRYAKLWLRIHESVPGIRDRRPIRKIFRVLVCLICAASGIGIATHLSSVMAIRILLACLLAVVGFLVGWKIQNAVMKIQIRSGKGTLITGYLCLAVWLLLGVWADQVLPVSMALLAQIVGGFAAAFGSGRNKSWRLNACELLGLRYYLRHVKTEELKARVEQNPEYFFDMLPYAMAFGVEHSFAQRFGRMIMPQCGYVEHTRVTRRTAAEWAALLSRTADKLDAGHIRMSRGRWLFGNGRRY
ncbi:MAG: DUF2207 domain-containing protein [Oscillospiraceae bacterium]|nr:DUF2207 domain-containing protein [Oscillospiraceae bacterium]